MNNRLIPWLMVSAGGFLIWAAIKNKNPLDIAKGVLSGDLTDLSKAPDWAAPNEPGIVGGPIGPANAAPGPTRPIAGSTPLIPIDPKNPPQVF